MSPNPSARQESEEQRLDRELIAPTAYHRLVFRERDKPHLIKLSSQFALAGLIALAIAMNGAVLLIADVLFKDTTVVLAVVATATLYITLWFGIGLRRRLSNKQSH